MQPRGEHTSRRWPLRLVLGLALAGLLLAGLTLHRTPSISPTTVATTLPTGLSSTLSPTTTASHPVTTTLQSPITNPGAFATPGRGCRLSTRVTGLASSATSTTAPARPLGPSPLGRCVVLEIGDSVGNDLGWGLARELKATPGLTLVQVDRSSTGLSNSGFYNWPQKARQFIARYHPELVIALFGANDEQGIEVDGHGAPFLSTTWLRAYETEVRTIATDATKSGSYVLWVAMPIMGPNSYRQGMASIDAIDQRVTTRVPGVTFLPTWDLFANAKHQFEGALAVNGVAQVLREPDGIHFTLVGEDVFATYVTRAIATIYHVVVRPEFPATITRR